MLSLFSLLLFYNPLPSLANEFSWASSQSSYEALFQKNISQAFWLKTRQSLKLADLEEWKKITKQPELFYSFANRLKNENVLLDHFYSFFSNKENKLETQENNLQVIKQVQELFLLLKQGPLEDLQKFIKEQGFSKTEKILAVLYTAYHGYLGAEIFDLMSEINLSVNDSLTFNELNSSFLPQAIQNSKETAVVLSHWLMASKEPEIIERLMEQDIDFNLKALTKDNFIHFYILLNNTGLNTKKEEKNMIKGLKAFLQFPQAQRLLYDKNNLGIAPLQYAFFHNDKKIRQIFLEELKKLQIDPDSVPIQTSYSDLWVYMSQKQASKESSSSITYLNFKAFVENLFAFFEPYQNEGQRQMLGSFLSDFQEVIMEAEQARLSLIHDVLTTEQKELKNIRLMLKAIINRDKSLFKKIEIQTEKDAEHFFKNLFLKRHDTVYLLSSLLSEAIRHSFTPAVGYLLKLSREFPSVQKQLQNNSGIPSFNLDPLSLAFITYGSLNEKDPLKASSKTIIQLLYKSPLVFEKHHFPLNFTPLEWALFFGMLEEVRFLHESKKIKFSPGVELEIDSRRWAMDWKIYLKEQGFKNLIAYLNSLNPQTKPEQGNSIEEILNRIGNTASTKAKSLFSQVSAQEWMELALGPKLAKKYQQDKLTIKDLESLSPLKNKQNSQNGTIDINDFIAERVMEEFKNPNNDKKACKQLFH